MDSAVSREGTSAAAVKQQGLERCSETGSQEEGASLSLLRLPSALPTGRASQGARGAVMGCAESRPQHPELSIAEEGQT